LEANAKWESNVELLGLKAVVFEAREILERHHPTPAEVDAEMAKPPSPNARTRDEIKGRQPKPRKAGANKDNRADRHERRLQDPRLPCA
jgi:hypothetical protein